MSSVIFTSYAAIFRYSICLNRNRSSLHMLLIYYYHYNNVAKYFPPASIRIKMSVVQTGEVWYPRLLLGPILNSLINNVMKKNPAYVAITVWRPRLQWRRFYIVPVTRIWIITVENYEPSKGGGSNSRL